MTRRKQMIAVLSSTLVLGVTSWFSTHGVTPLMAAEEGGHWSYEGESGPANWGGACKEGKEQSPINIAGATGADLVNVAFNYQPSRLEIVNNGHTIQANYGAGSSIQVDGATYNLVQFHFHAPSEHTVDGKSFPLEAHLVHKDANGRLAVVGVLFDEGAPGSSPDAEAKILTKAPKDKGGTVTEEQFNATSLLPPGKMTYRYNGSLTTPPCSESVRWIVMKESMKVAPEALAALKAVPAMKTNNRPVQPLNTRALQEDTTP